MRKIIVILLMGWSCITYGQWDSIRGDFYPGPDNIGGVSALQSYQGDLYIGGMFTFVPEGYTGYDLVTWNGSLVQSVSSGYGGYIRSEVLYNGNIVVAGSFDTVAGYRSKNISMGNGSSWSALGQGIHGLGLTSLVNALIVYNGNLIAGGYFDSAGTIAVSNIALWNGSTWISIGNISGSIGVVCCLAVYKGNLYVGGQFDSVAGKYIKNLAMWNGSGWSAVGGGIADTMVNSMAVYNNELYIGGFNNTKTNGPSPYLQKWNGTSWSNVGAGFNCSGQYFGVNALIVYDSLLCVGGTFDSVAGIKADNLAYWNGSNWGTFGGVTYSAFGAIPAIEAFGIYDSTLYVGGYFDTADGFTANCIARWKETPLGIEELPMQKNECKVYPNPTTGITNFELQGMNEAPEEVDIYNVLGEKVYSNQFVIRNSQFVINISNNPPGLYIYRIISHDGMSMASGKIVIQQ